MRRLKPQFIWWHVAGGVGLLKAGVEGDGALALLRLDGGHLHAVALGLDPQHDAPVQRPRALRRAPLRAAGSFTTSRFRA
jgi:hypothetical protein